MNSPETKSALFRSLHYQDDAFILPNPWDVGSARLLDSLGFKALATTSSGMAHSLGLRDGKVSKQQCLQHCKSIVAATDLPVSADLEKGFADTPDAVAQTIHDAANIGLAGCSIEDHTGRPDDPIFDFELAVERIRAAAQAKQSLPIDFVLTARAENLLWGKLDIDDTIKRLQAFEKAGADVLFAPGLKDLKTIKLVCSALTKPVNVVVETLDHSINLQTLTEVGVKRISIGSKLALTAYGAMINAAKEIMEQGDFSVLSQAVEFSTIENHFSKFEND